MNRRAFFKRAAAFVAIPVVGAAFSELVQAERPVMVTVPELPTALTEGPAGEPLTMEQMLFYRKRLVESMLPRFPMFGDTPSHGSISVDLHRYGGEASPLGQYGLIGWKKLSMGDA